jgi:hypothetical protein
MLPLQELSCHWTHFASSCDKLDTSACITQRAQSALDEAELESRLVFARASKLSRSFDVLLHVTATTS